LRLIFGLLPRLLVAETLFFRAAFERARLTIGPHSFSTSEALQSPKKTKWQRIFGILCQRLGSLEVHMPTRNVVLTDHQASLVEQLVSSGRYQNASEVLREGLRLGEQREAEDAYRLQALRAAAQLGLADIEAGRLKSFDSKSSLRAHLLSVTSKVIAVP
jgi:antitoxin ParD1/3/4